MVTQRAGRPQGRRPLAGMLQYAGPPAGRAREVTRMRIEQPHALGQQEAIGRVNRLLDGLIQAPPGGATIKEVRKRWDGQRMTFSFTISRGFFGAAFSGTMDVTDDRVVVASELPALVKGFVGEERIQSGDRRSPRQRAEVDPWTDPTACRPPGPAPKESPSPLGATWNAKVGAWNFALYSKHATVGHPAAVRRPTSSSNRSTASGSTTS